MSRIRGLIGFSNGYKTKNAGVKVEEFVERDYVMDVLTDTRKLEHASQVNDNLGIAMKFSVLCDSYARTNVNDIRYVVYHGTKWKVSTFTVNWPRITLNVGGEFNAAGSKNATEQYPY